MVICNKPQLCLRLKWALELKAAAGVVHFFACIIHTAIVTRSFTTRIPSKAILLLYDKNNNEHRKVEPCSLHKLSASHALLPFSNNPSSTLD